MSGPACRVDLTRPDDAPAIAALTRAYLAELGLEQDPAGLDKDLVDPLAAYDGGGFLVIRQGGELIGCVGVRDLGQGVAELKRMYLAPAARGLGLGRRLLERAIDLARRRGFRRLVLDTRLELAAANRLYEAAGFVDIPDYNQNPRAQRFMALDLDPRPA